MSGRKCVYTGKDANCKDKVIPHDGGDIDHNWANTVPCNSAYKNNKGNRLPTDKEMEINETFKLLELARMKVDFFEKKLKKLQEENVTLKVKKSAKQKRKDKEIKTAYKEKEIKEVDLDKIVEKKKKNNAKVLW